MIFREKHILFNGKEMITMLQPVIQVATKVPWATVGKYAVKGLGVAGVAATEAVLKGIFKKDIEEKVAELHILDKLKGAKN